MLPNNALVIVLGPTGAGKSDLALSLAQKYSGEIVNCDSLQLYRYLDIGTAKVPPGERRGIEHHLIDVLDPDQVFNAADYSRLARPVLASISSRNRLPIVVGGTGFYLRALLDGLSPAPQRDEALRARLMERLPKLHRILNRLDPRAAARIHPNDSNKLIRAVEICLLSRRPLESTFAQAGEGLEGYIPLKIGLDPPRAALVEKLNTRCEQMFQSGLPEELARVRMMGFPDTSKAFESIGYREALLHLTDVLDRTQAISQTQVSTRQYAKRQRTWFYRELDVQWLAGFGTDPATSEKAIDLVEKYLQCL